MDCYKIARRIMDRIRKQMCYDAQTTKIYHKVEYCDLPTPSHEFFTLAYDGTMIYVSCGKIYKLELKDPRGIIHFSLYLWLKQLDRMTR